MEQNQVCPGVSSRKQDAASPWDWTEHKVQMQQLAGISGHALLGVNAVRSLEGTSPSAESEYEKLLEG